MQVSVGAKYKGLIVNTTMNKGSLSELSSREVGQLIIYFNRAGVLLFNVF